MSARLVLLPIFVCFNLIALLALGRVVGRWVSPEHRRQAGNWTRLLVLLLNIPLLVFYFPRADELLRLTPQPLLRIFFYPATAWLATIIAFFFISVPAAMAWGVGKRLPGWIAKSKHWILGSAAPTPREVPDLARRSLLSGIPGLFIPGIYGVAAYGLYSGMGEIDVSKEYSIPIPHLPRSLEGLTIAQISDLHVGPYIRERELQHIVDFTNQLHPDLVVITGDVLDRHLSSLPDAVNGLKGLRAPLGVFAVLGNHDFYADPYSRSSQFRGGIHIAEGLQSAGIQTLRNQVVHLGSGRDRLALMGLDWLTASPGDRNFFRYRPVETRGQLRRMAQEVGTETPSILLAHHPDTFLDVPAEIGLTLSGHTHGGGQVILGYVNGVPIGIATLRFKYLSGLYQEQGRSLYVNRGIGYLGIPIRINCPPEISRFKLIRPAAEA